MSAHARGPGIAVAEMRSDRTPEAVRAFGVRRALAAFRSPEFEALMDQEINYMYFTRVQMERGGEATNEMLRMVVGTQNGEGR